MEVEVKAGTLANGGEFIEQLLEQKIEWKQARKLFREMYIRAAIERAGNRRDLAAAAIGMHVNSMKDVKPLRAASFVERG